jgi:hypothetical protein
MKWIVDRISDFNSIEDVFLRVSRPAFHSHAIS